MGGLNTFAYAPNPVGWIDPLGLNKSCQGKFSSEEKSIADYLKAMGRKVEPNSDEGKAGLGRQPDAIIDGLRTEFKTIDLKTTPIPGSNTIKNIVADSARRGGQARELIIDARHTCLSKDEAQRGIFRALGANKGKIDRVTVMGNGYFIGYGQRKS